MARRRTQIAINTKPAADNYASEGERLVEFSHPDCGGGLISFKVTYPDGNPVLSVHVYRFDEETVRPSVGGYAG